MDMDTDMECMGGASIQALLDKHASMAEACLGLKPPSQVPANTRMKKAGWLLSADAVGRGGMRSHRG